MRAGARCGLFSLVGVLIALGAGPAQAAQTLDQQQPIAPGFPLPLDSTTGRAQTFVPGLTGKLTQVDLSLGRHPEATAFDAITVEIRTATLAGPTNVVLASTTIPASSVPSAQAWIPVTFATPAVVNPFSLYAIVATTTQAPSYVWGGYITNPYTNGDPYYLNEGTWFFSGELGPSDMSFRTYVTESCASHDATIAGSGNIVGTPGNDVIVGGPGPDVIDGGGGDDLICARGGDDRVVGGAGNDELRGEAGNNRLFGGAGGASTDPAGGDDTLYGDDGNDRLFGEGGNDLSNGAGGNDVISDATGNDTAHGSDGNDQISTATGNDFVTGGYGDDRINAGPGTDFCDGDDGIDVDNNGGTRTCETSQDIP
jgi:Ca2+-binding RTX toxin-like protein